MTKNIMKIKFVSLLIFFVTACSTFQKPITSSSDSSSTLSSFCFENNNRVPSSESMCKGLFKENADTNYAKQLQNDPLQSAEARANMSVSGLENPVELTPKMQDFRKRFLGFFKSSVVREALTRSFESSLRMRSALTGSAIQQSNNYAQYDVVIIGAGVHGVIALHQVLKSNPNLKILLVDDGDTAGPIFRYGKDIFSINSSNRASGEEGARPLPGEGNINELQGLPIQVSDLTAVKYPSANDLGTALVAGLYAAVRENPNVDVLFNTKAKSFLNQPQDKKMKESIMVSQATAKSDFQIDAQKVILATGLGDPALPSNVVRTLTRIDTSLRESVNGNPPRVLTFEDMIRIIAESNDPMSFFKDKKIGVVGKGDSANVFIEFLMGYAPAAAYGRSSGQSGKPSKVFWIGQNKQTCEQFISDIRSRYQGISTGFRSSSVNLAALIESTGSKLNNVADNGSGKVNVVLENNQIIDNLDYVVVATGFNQNIRSLFDQIKVTRGQDENTFLTRSFDILESRTAVSPGLTKVGRKLTDREVYVVGTAAGDLTEKRELVGIIQNFVSIFNNAPRVVAAVKKVFVDLKPVATVFNRKKIVIDPIDEPQTFTIGGVNETRLISNQTLAYLEATFKEALTSTLASSENRISLNILLANDGTLKIQSETKVDVKGVVALLAESRDFFSLTKELLKFLPGQSLQFTAASAAKTYDLASAKAQIVKVSSTSITATPTTFYITNSQIRMRGLEFDSNPIKRNSEGDFFDNKGKPLPVKPGGSGLSEELQLDIRNAIFRGDMQFLKEKIKSKEEFDYAITCNLVYFSMIGQARFELQMLELLERPQMTISEFNLAGIVLLSKKIISEKVIAVAFYKANYSLLEKDINFSSFDATVKKQSIKTFLTDSVKSNTNVEYFRVLFRTLEQAIEYRKDEAQK